MRVKLESLSGAVSKVSAFTNGDKQVGFVMLDIKGNEMNVCYSDGRKSFIEKIEIENAENVENKVAVDFDRLQAIVNACSPSGKMKLDDVEIVFKDNNVMEFKADKKIVIVIDENTTEEKVISTFKQDLGYEIAGSSMKTQMLTRANYDAIFEGAEVNEWDVNELKNVFNKTISGDGKILYVSPKKSNAFIVNTAYTGAITIEGEYSYPLVVSNVYGKQLVGVLGKLNGKVNIHLIDKKIICVYDEAKKVGLQFEAAEPNKMHIVTLDRFMARGYKAHQFTILTDAFKDILSAAITTSQVDRTSLIFEEKDGVVLKISGGSAQTTKNEYIIECTDYVGEDNLSESLEVPVSLRVLKEVVDKCDSEYIGIDIDIEEGVKIIRVGDLNKEKKDKIMAEEYKDKEVTTEDKLNIRDRILDAKYYMLSSK